MKKTVLTFGLISGAISSVMMAAAIPFQDRIGFERAEIVGYTTIVLSFLLVYFGIRSYRDNVGQGHITFWKALGVGVLITLVSSVCYVVTWEIIYYNFLPDFMDKYGAYLVAKAKASGATPDALQAQLQQLKEMKRLYQNPFFNAALTFVEPLPIGLAITLLSAAVLRRRTPSQGAEAALPAS